MDTDNSMMIVKGRGVGGGGRGYGGINDNGKKLKKIKKKPWMIQVDSDTQNEMIWQLSLTLLSFLYEGILIHYRMRHTYYIQCV